MEIFLDSSDIVEIKEYRDFIDGVTTNPSLLAKIPNPKKTIEEICAIIPGPISMEVIATSVEEMISEIKEISKIAPNIVVKIPLTKNGLKALKFASEHGIETNVTLCFSESQAIFTAKFGATYVSPFVGRLDDLGLDGTNLIRNISTIFKNYDYDTRILAASIRSTNHVVDIMKAGADAVTVPTKILKQMLSHPLTDIGLANFLKDWNNRQK